MNLSSPSQADGGDGMKLKFPAEAFALGIILFSAGMKEAFLCGGTA